MPGLGAETAFVASGVVTGLAFFGVGLGKGAVLERPAFRSGFETLLMGGAAALLAYGLGFWLRQVFGAG